MFIFQTGQGVRQDVLDSYCWMNGHLNGIPNEYHGPCAGQEQDSSDGILYNSFYQWVALFLATFSVVSYLPR